MDFTRIDDAVAACKAHLDATNSRGTEIESFLVAHLLITIGAEYENFVERIIVKRAERTADAHVHSFVKRTAHRIIRSVKVTEISGHLACLGGTCKDDFQKAVNGTISETHYGNIITNRHMVAHDQQLPNMTMAELETALPESKKVLEAVANAIGLTAAEMASL